LAKWRADEAIALLDENKTEEADPNRNPSRLSPPVKRAQVPPRRRSFN
jgi:hypothetical protein